PALDVAVGEGLEGEAAGDIDQRIEPAEMRCGCVDRLLGRSRVRKIDAAELDPLGRGRHLRRCVIDAGDARATFLRGFGDHPAERAQRSRDDDDFSVHDHFSATGSRSTLAPVENHLQWSCISRRNGLATSDSKAGMIHMVDTPQACDPHFDLFQFAHPLRHLTESICRGRRTKIVAIGSSSTAGEPTAPDWQVKIVPYPARPELACRRNYYGAMIDVLNRGLGGQEAPGELSRFASGVIADGPALLI